MVIKKRSIALFIILNTLTLGIYGIVIFSMMSDEIEQICAGDGKKQMHYIFAWLLGLVTLGIVPLIWFHTAMNRLQDNAYRYGDLVRPQYSGNSYLLWMLLGMFIVVGPIVAVCQFISDVNAYADVAGNVRPLPYTPNPVERMNLINKARSEGGYGAMGRMGYGAPAQPGMPPVAQPLPPVAQKPAAPASQPVNANRSVPPTAKASVDEVGATVAAAGAYKGQKTGGVTCVNGMYKGITFPISDGEEMILGTDPSCCNVVISQNNTYISRRHCTVRYSISGDTYTVIDHSTNGTFCANGQQLMKNAPKMLKTGDIIHLGDANNSYRFG